MATRIFMNGCLGRMGRAITAMADASEDFEIVAGGDLFDAPEGFKYPVYKDSSECKEDFDVIIDFSNAKAVPAVLDLALSRNKPLVLCTTAIDEETLKKVDEASSKIAIFKSSNMSYGMNVLFELVKQATRALYPGFDIEIVEAHHNRKLDAPSGTAYTIAECINNEAGGDLEYVYDRHSRSQKRDPKEIGISSIRGGNIVGEHEVYFISDEETVKISHSAATRDAFARGALTAASYVKNAAPGFYSMKDVVEKILGK
ncbi:MAG: 4-hydroxy-tetrahydrodipicolinate reductase [Clostridiales bacterium]|nr:4-hydroxy-tetrahydrodipicolinate reductase [Clostridiales bacterium]